jgi:hypothetical protein
MRFLASVCRIFAKNRHGKFSASAISAVVMNLAETSARYARGHRFRIPMLLNRPSVSSIDTANHIC